MTINFDRLREAAAIVEGIPDKRFSLNTVRGATNTRNLAECGSVGCVMGWIGLHPKVNEQGLKIKFFRDPNRRGQRSYMAFRTPQHLYTNFAVAASDYFGITETEAHSLFGPLFGPDSYLQNHKHVFRHRLKGFLREHNQPVSAAYDRLKSVAG